MERLGPYLRERRKEHQWTLQYIAERMGTTAVYVSDIEREKRRPLKPSILQAIARAYQLELEEVQKVAMGSRDSVQLDNVDQSEVKRETAIMLARAWTDLPEEKVRAVRHILEKE